MGLVSPPPWGLRSPEEVKTTPGTGLVNFPKVLVRLKAGGFVRGPLIVEYTAVGSDLKQTIEKARKFIE